MSNTHELKTWPVYFHAVKDGRKTFEVRKNDRDFGAGDVLVLKEWNPANGFYTGQSLRKRVEYVLYGTEDNPQFNFGIEPGYCVMALSDRTA